VTALAELRAFVEYDQLSFEGKETYERLIAAVLAERVDLAEPLSEEAIDRAVRVYHTDAGPAYMAHSRDYLGPVEEWRAIPEGSEERRARLAALHAADEEASRQNHDLMRRAIAAALGG
jgi:hypothetical protein